MTTVNRVALAVGFAIAALGAPGARAAEYCGESIDGEVFAARAHSHATNRYYEVEAEFDGDQVIVTFSRGGTLRLKLKSVKIEDPRSIQAFDSQRGTAWDIDVSDLPECGDR